MKTSATTTTLETPSSSNRRQPLRQTRTNPARTATRPFSGRGALDGPSQDGSTANTARGFFPAITHFTDSITALPKEMIRHYTMLKEVDAKIYGPEETLKQLVTAALKAPVPPRPNPQPHTNHDQSSQSNMIDNATSQAINGIRNGPNQHADATSPTNLPPEPTAEEVNRKHLFFNIRNILKDMLNTLDEKNHVMSTATDALERQLARCETSYPQIENEISDEARNGNINHWAYMERPAEKKGTTAGERTRREAAIASVAAAAAAQAHDGEPATNRSEARREAVAARKSRNHQVDSDFDDARPAGHGSAKKPAGPGKRKAAEQAQTNQGPISALGIPNGSNGGANSSAPKRRKIERPAPTGNMGGAVMERSMSGVYGPTAGNSRGRAGSPSATSLLDSTKRKPRGGGMTNGSGRRRAGTNTSAANSPSLASSPVVSSFPATAKNAASPLPPVMQRTQSARGRQNSTQSIPQANRPPSSASNKQVNGTNIHAVQMDLDKFSGANGKNNTESKNSIKDAVAKGSPRIEEVNNADMDGAAEPTTTKRATDKAPKREEAETTNNSRTRAERPPSISTSTRNAGKASKTATPISATFPEPSRPRSNRNNHKDEPVIKRSHKKGAGLAAQAQLAAQQAAKEHREDGGSQSSAPEEEEAGAEDEEEPRYCYCNQVSYGEMVACDYDGCKKEWFHLDCAGMSKAPQKTSKWYCKDCKEIMKKGGSQPSSR